MAKLLSTLLMAALAFYSTQARRESDTEHDLLKGRIHNIQISIARLSNKAGKLQEGNPEFSQSLTYDTNGDLLEHVFLEGELRVRHLYSYDSKGNRIAREIGRDGSRLLSWIFKYDAAGNRVEEVVSDANLLMRRTIYTYDSNQNRIEEISNTRYLTPKKWVYSYDDGGKIGRAHV